MRGPEEPARENDRRALPGAAWVLTLLASDEQVDVLLSDGLDRFESGQCILPGGDGAPVWPPGVAGLMSKGEIARLRLQLPVSLDTRAWEADLEPALPGVAISRHVSGDDQPTSLPCEPLGSTSRVDPLWLHAPVTDASAVALHARATGRPLLVVAAELPRSLARRLRGEVLLAWIEGRWFAHAATQAAALLGLPRRAWRVYGDACFEPLAAEGEQRRRLTALSFDVVGSTLLLHVWGAERYARQHAELHRRCQEEVRSRGGRLDEPRGNDGWMAYFGLGRLPGDAAAAAVLAADAVTRLAPELGFDLRAGVASGRLVLRHGDAFGPEVHLAARLRALAPPGGVVVCGETEALLGPGIERESLGAQPLRGFDRPQPAFRIVSVSSPELAARPRAPHGRLVGRHDELSALMQAWHEARRQRSGAWFAIAGEPGIGKTRLLREFSRALQSAEPAVMSLRLDGRRELQASAFAALSAGLQGEPFNALAQPLRSFGERGPGSEPGGALQRQRLLDALVEGTLALAATASLCVIVDDAQWLDPSTLEFVERLRAGAAHVPLLIVVALRDDERSLACGLPAEPGLWLRALDREQALQLLGSLPSAHVLDDPLRQRIVDRAGGNPLYLEETARMVEASTERTLAQQQIPATLDELLTARLESLGAARALLQLAAVLGADFPTSLWEAVRAEPDLRIASAAGAEDWQQVLASGLLIEDATAPLRRLRFKHALIRDAAYESLWQQERARLHGIVARVIERGIEGLDAALQLRAAHLAAAGEPAAAADAWHLAAQQAAAAAADREALALAQRALDLLAQLPDSADRRQQALQLHLLQAARCIALDGYGAPSVEAAYLRASALCSGTQDRAMLTRVELGLEACYAMRGDLVRARALAEAAVRDTGWQPNPRLALQARWAWVNVVFHQGELDAAMAMIDECLAHYDPSLHQPRAVQDPAIMCLSYGAWGLFEQGRAGRALQRIEQLLALARQLDHPFSHAVAHGFAASVRLFRGEFDEGLAQAEEAVRRCSAGDFQAWLAHARVIRGRLWAAQGDACRGLAEMEEGLALWLGTGARITGATYLAFQAEACLMRGETAEAWRRLQQAREMAQRHGERYYEAELLRLQGWVCWLQRRSASDAAQARELIERGRALAREQGRLGFALRSALALGRIDVEHGQAPLAILRLQEALDAIPDHHATADASEARQALHAWRQPRHAS